MPSCMGLLVAFVDPFFDAAAVAPYERVRRGVVLELGLVAAASSGTIRPASTLPSSTPHWSNESIPRRPPA